MDAPVPRAGLGGGLTVGRVLGYAGWAVMQVFRNFGTLGLRLNLLWFLAALPLLPAVGIPVALAVQQAANGFDSPQTPLLLALALLGATGAACLTAGPATLALVHATARFVQGDEIGIADFWRALRRYWPRGWLVLFADLLMLYALVFGFYFYLNSGQLLLQAFAFVALYLTLVWGRRAGLSLFPLVIRADVSLPASVSGRVCAGARPRWAVCRVRAGRRRGRRCEPGLCPAADGLGSGYSGLGRTSNGARPDWRAFRRETPETDPENS